jgi:hypothetical protein
LKWCSLTGNVGSMQTGCPALHTYCTKLFAHLKWSLVEIDFQTSIRGIEPWFWLVFITFVLLTGLIWPLTATFILIKSLWWCVEYLPIIRCLLTFQALWETERW